MGTEGLGGADGAPAIRAAAPPGVVATALADVARVGPYFAPVVGGPQESSRPVGEAYAEGLGALIDGFAARLGGAEPRVAASILQLGHAARLWSPVLACALLHGVVPDLRGLRFRPEGPELSLSSRSGWLAGNDPARLAYEVVVREHLQPLAAGLRVKVAPGLLRGNAASALIGSATQLLRARPAVREPLTTLVATLLDTGDLRGTGKVTGPELTFQRHSCCLFYRVPNGGLCGDCPFPAAPRP